MKSPQRSALLHVSVIVDVDTEYGVHAPTGQVWVGGAQAGYGDVVLSGDVQGFENLAAALMLAATEMREEQLVAALGTAGQPQTAGAA